MSVKISTAADIAEWMNSQSRPKRQTRAMMVLRPTATDAMQQFTLQYNRLVRQKINSKIANKLRMAVVKAETAKDVIDRLPAKVRTQDSLQDALSRLQLDTFAAASWIRRFADDRHTKGAWVEIEEKRAGRVMAEGIERRVTDLINKISEKNASKTVTEALQVFEVKWRQQEIADLKLVERENDKSAKHLKKEFGKVKSQDASSLSEEKRIIFKGYCTELEDSPKEMTPEQVELVKEVKEWLKSAEETEAPAWRVNGIKELGPFGIAAKLNIELDIEYPPNSVDQKLAGKFTAKGPKTSIAPYEESLGGVVSGPLSPLFPVTIRRTDPSASLIRIPFEARFFAFAYPVITSKMEVKIEKKTQTDAFLLYGGFLYFDANMKLIQTNGLWVGSNLNMSAPMALPESVATVLKETGRFRDITLDYLAAKGAKQFAWVLPNEFKELNAPHGGWCYLYEDEAVNNYFAVASAESVMGLTKAFSLHDIKG